MTRNLRTPSTSFLIGIIFGTSMTLLSCSVFGIHFGKLNQMEEPNSQLDISACDCSLLLKRDEKVINSHSKLRHVLTKLATEIKIAKQHVRGTKTSDALQKATKSVMKSLKLLNVDWQKVTMRKLNKPRSVCPENHSGPKKTKQYYTLKGFYVENCSYHRALEDIITIVAVREPSQSYSLTHLITSIRKYNPNINVYVGTETNDLNITKKHVKLFPLIDKQFIGKAWNELIRQVKTEYLLIARDITWFNEDARLDRLIRQLERVNVTTVGGATRNIVGQWSIGCHQRAFRNFTLVYEAGYDVSLEECLFCDHLDGPFVMKTFDAKKQPFSETISNQGLFEDFFLRNAHKENLVCPDSMFFTNRSERSYRHEDWNDFVKTWMIMKMKFSGRIIDIPCDSKYECYPIGKGGGLTPCCMSENADLLNAVLSMCAEIGAYCQSYSGSNLGSVKLHGVLPWERDADTTFLSANFSALTSSLNKLHKLGYSTTFANTTRCCNIYKGESRLKGGTIKVKSKRWRLEMFGYSFLESEPVNMEQMLPTLIPMNGKWTRSTRNPGLTMRQRYGRELFQHAQHWMDTGHGTSWIDYKVNKFIPCPVPNHQSCLDRYNGDGNLQFRDPIP